MNEHKLEYKSARKLFMQWFNKNLKSFPGIRIKNANNTFRFKGMHPDIEFQVGFIDIDVIFYHEGKCWDIILVADLPEIEKEDDAYFCKECFKQTGKKEIYDSAEAILEDHTVKSLRRWIRRNLRAEKKVLFFKDPGVSWVEICDEGEVEMRIKSIKEEDNGLAISLKPMILER